MPPYEDNNVTAGANTWGELLTNAMNQAEQDAVEDTNTTAGTRGYGTTLNATDGGYGDILTEYRGVDENGIRRTVTVNNGAEERIVFDTYDAVLDRVRPGRVRQEPTEENEGEIRDFKRHPDRYERESMHNPDDDGIDENTFNVDK
jgi:hypothetical protein